ncbi:MAG: ATP-grasp domain-containing protein [Microcoleaceae cyanobacterium]
MDLLEYQAKALFREVGIPVLPSQRIDQAQDLKRLTIPYPVVLKSQVRAGGRGKAGGIKFVGNTIDAVAAAQAIFNLPILDEYPQVLLAEVKYDADQELYLAVTLDPRSRRPMLLGSLQGGEEMPDEVIAQVQKVMINQEFSSFYARRLAVNIGLEGELILKVSSILERMYHLFVDKDLDLVEINPLGISPTGEVMALDGKVIANSGALNRHPDLIDVVETCRYEVELDPLETQAEFEVATPSLERQLACSIDLLESDGNIGILCNGKGLTLATADAIIQAEGKLAFLFDFGEEDYLHMSAPLLSQLHQSLEIVSNASRVRVVLIQFLGHLGELAEVGTEIAKFIQQRITHDHLPQYVLRLTGTAETKFSDHTALQHLKACFDQLPVQIVSSLEAAVTTTITLAQQNYLSYEFNSKE